MIDPTAAWRVTIDDQTSFTGTVSGFSPDDSFDLTNVVFDPAGSATLLSGNVLQIVENAGTFTINLDPGQDFTGYTFQLAPDSDTGTLISEAVCFCRGTRILTEHGEVPVEALAVGDRVMTLSGAAKAIVWIGLGRDLVTGKNPLARPIVVAAGALADGVPRRDLYLTHGHALYLEGVLIPVEQLVNHRTIRWDEEARVVEYYHIELDDHDVLIADGAAAESYYDAGNRALFHNTRPRSAPAAPGATCAPVLSGGEVVARLWQRLAARAGACPAAETSDDPDLHLVVAGARLDPARIADGVYTFRLAGPPDGTLHLRSRSVVPSLAGQSRHEHRRLGVAIRQIVLRAPGVTTCLDHDAALFVEGGCHPPERGLSWTDGEFSLPARLFQHLQAGSTVLVHTSRQSLRYPIAAPLAEAA
ncbi:MAG TPA: Hint domain-containing protein [Stellaceae bacterium]|nr:Hint domain-containing protein [Stellaceae bacterium]